MGCNVGRECLYRTPPSLQRLPRSCQRGELQSVGQLSLLYIRLTPAVIDREAYETVHAGITVL